MQLFHATSVNITHINNLVIEKKMKATNGIQALSWIFYARNRNISSKIQNYIYEYTLDISVFVQTQKKRICVYKS